MAEFTTPMGVPGSRLVVVRWMDAKLESEWKKVDAFLSDTPPRVDIIGWLVKEDAHALYIMHGQAEDGEVYGYSIIPRGMVLSVTEVQTKEVTT